MSKMTHSNKPEKDMNHFFNKYLKIVIVLWQKVNIQNHLLKVGCIHPRFPVRSISNELQI